MRHCVSLPSLQTLVCHGFKAKFGAVETGGLLCISNPEGEVVKSNIASRAFRLHWEEREGCSFIVTGCTEQLYTHTIEADGSLNHECNHSWESDGRDSKLSSLRTK